MVNKIFIKESIRKYFNKQYKLKENVNQAEKLLKLNDISLDDPDYLKIKNLLLNSNNIGYLGLIVKLSINSNTPMFKIYEIIQNYKQILNRLPKQIHNYDNFEDLLDDIEKTENYLMLKKIGDKLTNPIIKKEITTVKLNDKLKYEIEYFLNLKSADQKEFLAKSDKYKDIDGFFKGLESFNNDIRTGFTYEIVLSKILSLSKNDIKVLYDNKEKQLIFARIINYTASRMIGSQSWCIVGDENQFNEYTKNGENYQYFLFNFNLDIPENEKMIAFTMNKENKVTASHDRYDDSFKNPLAYLQKIGISEKIFMLNSRQFAEDKINSTTKANKITVSYSSNYTKDKTRNPTPNYYINSREKYFIEKRLIEISLNFLSVLFNKDFGHNHLDIIFEKYQSYPLTMTDYDGYVKDYNKTYNIIIDIINNFDKIMVNYRDNYIDGMPDNITKKDFVNIMKKVYLSNINLENETKISILHFLKNNGVDVLKLSQQKKNKNNQNLSDMEFAMLKNKGEDLKPIIQNKLSALRRGEPVNLNFSEIKYAIENGLKPIIQKYYKNQIPYYSENQLSYEDMVIYKELGLFKDVSDVIYKKGKTWGLDSLNSIEKSIYDFRSKIKK